MRAEYKVIGGTSYFCISELEEQVIGHELKMLLKNEIEGIIPVSVSYEDDILNMYYHVTGLLSLHDYFSRQKITKKDLEMLFQSMIQERYVLNNFLLDEMGVCVGPEEVFLDAKGKHRYIYNPFLTREEDAGSYSELSAFLLGHLDYSDKDGVLMAYQFQNMCSCGHVSISLIRQYWSQEENRRNTAEEEARKEITQFRAEVKAENNKTEVHTGRNSEKPEKRISMQGLIRRLFTPVGEDCRDTYTCQETEEDDEMLRLIKEQEKRRGMEGLSFADDV